MGEINLIEILGKLGLYFVPFLFALSFHEFAHGWVARRKGDNTAELMGRLTLNPFAHADLVGTFVLPILAIVTGWGFLFGWAKPVPVNDRNLKHPKEDMFWIAAAGPISNLLLAAIGTIIFVGARVFFGKVPAVEAVTAMAEYFIFINLLLCVFNLLPFHPLDGAKVLARFIPDSWNRFLEEQQGMLQIGLIVFFVAGGFQFLAKPIEWIQLVLLQGVVGAFSLIL